MTATCVSSKICWEFMRREVTYTGTQPPRHRPAQLAIQSFNFDILILRALIWPAGEPWFVTSLELVEFINDDRKTRTPYVELQHADLLRKVPPVLGEIGAENLAIIYREVQNKEPPQLHHPQARSLPHGNVLQLQPASQDTRWGRGDQCERGQPRTEGGARQAP